MVCGNYFFFNRGRISSVGRALDFRAGGRGFNSWDQTNTQGLKMTEKGGTAFALQMARPSRGSDDHVKWRSERHKSIVPPVSAFVLNTLTLK